jgi:hypothetical protein
MFDEGFRGWGAEDQEWAFRVSRTGTPLLFQPDVYGLHLPHTRNINANFETLDANKAYFLAKWPILDVELYRAFDSWLDAAEAHRGVERELAEVAGEGHTLGVVRGTVDGADVLTVGAVLDGRNRLRDPEAPEGGSATQVLPLLGVALPFPDNAFARCRVLPPIWRLSSEYRDLVLREVERVSRSPVPVPVGNQRR